MMNNIHSFKVIYKAALRPEAKRKFNGIEFNHHEFEDGSGLSLYTAKFRGLDPTIAQWLQIDPRPNTSISPYAAMGLNPIVNRDFLGDTSIAYTNGWIIGNVGGDDNFIKTVNPLATITVNSSYGPTAEFLTYSFKARRQNETRINDLFALNQKILLRKKKDDFDPSETFKASKTLFISGAVKMDVYSTLTYHEGKSPVNLIINPQGKHNLIGTSVTSIIGTSNIGTDGSFSFGTKFLSIGYEPGNIFTIDLSFPTPFSEYDSYGTTIHYQPQVFWNWFGRALNKDIHTIYNTLPLSRPTAVPLIPAY